MSKLESVFLMVLLCR